MDPEPNPPIELRQPAPGEAIDAFVVQRTLGRGAVSIVVLAREPALDRYVALKLLNDRTYWTMDDDGRALLERSVRAVAALCHPNLVSVYACGHWEGWAYVAMEYVEGMSLRTWQRTHDHGWRRTVALFIEVAAGLAAAHDHGLLHCDLDMDTVLVGVDGRVKLAELYLGQPPPSLGENTAVFGTSTTTSPERIKGHGFDHRSDQFGFCALLWYAVHGRWPFEATSVIGVFRRVLAGDVQAPPDDSHVPERIRDLLRRGMAQEPELRWADMRQVAAQLQEALRDS